MANEHQDTGFDDVAEILRHKLRKMRNACQGERSICADEPFGGQICVVNPDLRALPDQPLDQRHHRRLSDIVGVLFEREADDPNILVRTLEDSLLDLLDLFRV